MNLSAHTSGLALVALGAALAGCAGGGAKAATSSCGGEDRPQLDCTSEFNYDATNMQGGFSALGIGSLDAKTEQKALHEIDTETEQYIVQSRRLCDEYNKCVVDRETYSMRAENLRRRMAKLPELYDGLKKAADPDAQRKALSEAYHTLVPDESRTELKLSFSVLARAAGQIDAAPVQEGMRLASGSRISFSVQLSRPAHVYLFQKSPSGALNVLFPDPRITVQNPVPAGQELRIPQGGASFKLDDKDIGTERVFIVASLEPISSLSQAVSGLQAGSAPSAPVTAVTQISKSSDCAKTRALSFEDDAPHPGCTRERGLSFDEDATPSQPSSITARSEAGDSVIARAFSFQHTP
jgi:Domain of unknown function (DUF4384)